MRRLATACVCVLALAACTGTTEARENRELEPGSGDLGSGDLVEQPDVFDDPVGGASDPGDEAPDTTVSVPGGAMCETPEGHDEITGVLTTVFGSSATLEERLAVVQLGDTPEVAERLRTERERAAEAGIAAPRAVTTTTVACADDAAASVAFRVWRDEGAVHRTASVMLVGGTWQLTLTSLCRLLEHAPCAEVPGMETQAAKLLSPSLRPRAGNG
jgi:hypothetical protein